MVRAEWREERGEGKSREEMRQFQPIRPQNVCSQWPFYGVAQFIITYLFYIGRWLNGSAMASIHDSFLFSFIIFFSVVFFFEFLSKRERKRECVCSLFFGATPPH